MSYIKFSTKKAKDLDLLNWFSIATLSLLATLPFIISNEVLMQNAIFITISIACFTAYNKAITSNYYLLVSNESNIDNQLKLKETLNRYLSSLAIFNLSFYYILNVNTFIGFSLFAGYYSLYLIANSYLNSYIKNNFTHIWKKNRLDKAKRLFDKQLSLFLKLKGLKNSPLTEEEHCLVENALSSNNYEYIMQSVEYLKSISISYELTRKRPEIKAKLNSSELLNNEKNSDNKVKAKTSPE